MIGVTENKNIVFLDEIWFITIRIWIDKSLTWLYTFIFVRCLMYSFKTCFQKCCNVCFRTPILIKY